MTQATSVKPVNTCSACPKFEDFQEQNGRGWCLLFDQLARTFHQQTDYCVLNLDHSTDLEKVFSTEIIEVDRE